MRHRAQTLLYFSEGCSAKDIATRQDLHLDTVYDRRKHWLKDGFASLADRQRSGAPPEGERGAVCATAGMGKHRGIDGP
jgi:transposase